uniref:DEF6 guanine nucleotide exchange factor b n=1 Tax=Astyanax mexicanus TaxID=7994 RepID=A0A8B9J6S5_ASTMX
QPQGYMPYLNKFILDKVVEGTFDKEQVDELCWTLCSKKNYRPNGAAVLSNKDAGRLWCLFNFLSEDKYPLTLVPEEVRRTDLTGYLWKKGHLRRNWTERWFCLKPSVLSYYTSEDRKECKGNIELDQNCCVEVLPEREGKRCMFCVKTLNKTYEMSAPDSKQRQEWTIPLHLFLNFSQIPNKNILIYSICLKQVHIHTVLRVQKSIFGGITLFFNHSFNASWHHVLLHQSYTLLLDNFIMREEMAQKEVEAERQRRRIRELEELQQRLEEALHQEIKARQDEENYRYTQTRLLAEEEEKTKALLSLQEEQEELLEEMQKEKRELRREMEEKAGALEEAHRQLESVRASRHRLDQDIAAAQRKQRQASTNVKHWNVQMTRLMHPIGPGGALLSLLLFTLHSVTDCSMKESSRNANHGVQLRTKSHPSKKTGKKSQLDCCAGCAESGEGSEY